LSLRRNSFERKNFFPLNPIAGFDSGQKANLPQPFCIPISLREKIDLNFFIGLNQNDETIDIAKKVREKTPV
jgi:hypothetical protein